MRAGAAARGFTLVELLVVISILSVLMGVGLGVVGRLRPSERAIPGVLRARLAAARSQARSLGAPSWVRFQAGPDAAQETLFLESASWTPLVSFSFEEGARGAFGLIGTMEGGKVVAEGRYGQGLAHEKPGAPGLSLETAGREHLALERGFLVRVDVLPAERRAMVLVRWGSSFSLGLDEAGRPQATLTMWGSGGLPGEKRELTGSRPLPLGRWATLELGHDGSRAHLCVAGRVEAVAPAVGRPYYKHDVPLVVSEAQHPIAGVLDEVRLFTLELEAPEALPQGLRLLEGPELIRFAPGGGLDPELHVGPVRLLFALPAGGTQALEVTVLGVVQ